VDIPESAVGLSFEYGFGNIGDGDYVAIFLDNVLIWTLSGSSYMGDGLVDSGLVPIGDLKGKRSLTVALYGVGEKNAEFEIHNISAVTTLTAMQVSIDIKPSSSPNSVNLGSYGVIPVAILTTDNFDAPTVDPLSVRFGPKGAIEAHKRGHVEDVNGDGKLDMVLHFNTQDTGIVCGATSAELTGWTIGGQPIEGIDSIQTVGCM
jgi:hypothetical protein